MPVPSRAIRFAGLSAIASLLLITAIACRHNLKPATPTTPPTPAGLHRASRDGIELTLDLPPTARWSAHAVIRLTNNSASPIHVPRHANSVLHDYQLKLRDESGADVPTRMMLQIPDRPPSTSRPTLKPSEIHEEGLQLGMLFALRPGERYILTITVPVQHRDKPDPTLLKIDDAHFTVTAN